MHTAALCFVPTVNDSWPWQLYFSAGFLYQFFHMENQKPYGSLPNINLVHANKFQRLSLVLHKYFFLVRVSCIVSQVAY